MTTMIVPRKTFVKRSGTTDIGKEYEAMVTAYLALAMTLDDDVIDFELSSNNDKFGIFDDIVLSVTKQNDETKRYAIQSKHDSKCKRNLAISSLMGTSGNFSLQKYCKEFHNIERSEGFQNILYTNLKLDIATKIDSKLDNTELSVTVVKVDHDHTDGLLSTSTASACYSFEISADDEENEEHKKYKEFFKTLTLYTNQDNLSSIKSRIFKTFEQAYNCGPEACKMFNEFVLNWAIREGRKFELNKEVVKLKIAECLLTPHLMVYDLPKNEEKQIQLFKDAMLQFDVTVLKNSVGKTLNVIRKNDAVDNRNVIKAGREFELIPDSVKSVNDLDIKQKHKILWYMNQAPLVIDFDKNSDLILKAIDMSKRKKFVFCTENFDKSQLAGLNVFESLSDLDRCTFSAEIVEQCTVSIQGRGHIPLKDVLSDAVKSMLTASSILEMLKDVCFEDSQNKTPEFYVDRAVTTTVLDTKCLKENDLFIINKQRSDIKLKIKPIQEFFSNKTKDDKEVILLTDEKWSGLENPKIQNLNRPYHQVRFIDDNKLEWINSKSSVNKLKKYRLSPHQESTIEESQLLNSDRAVNIVCSAPGMGKTFMMQYFYKNYSPKYWVTYIDLKLHCSHFKSNDSLDDTLNYVESIGTDSNNALDFELKKSFRDNRKMVLLWDALDEVPVANVKVIIEVIKKFKDLGYKQWIASRPHLKQLLEDSLDTFASDIVEFSEQQQESYIKRRLELDEEDFVRVHQKIVGLVGRMNSEFLGIPLLLFILTELFRKKGDWNFSSGMSRSVLYRYFVEEKFKTYYKKAVTCACNFDNNNIMTEILDEHRLNRLEMYEVMGAASCFGAGILSKFNNMFKKFEKRSDGVGIVTDIDGDDIPIFFHRTFAEYFAASWLTKHHSTFSNFETVIFQDEFKAVRFMFDSILAEDCPAHLAVLKGDLDELKNCASWIDFKDKGGRNVLHLLSSWGGTYPLLEVDKLDNENKYVVDCTPGTDVLLMYHGSSKELQKNVNLTYEEMYRYLLVEFSQLNPLEHDEIMQWSSFQYADAAFCLNPFEILLTKYSVDFSKLKNYSDTCTVAIYSVICNFVNVFNALESIPRIELLPVDGMLHLATRANASILQVLLKDAFYQEKINTFYPTQYSQQNYSIDFSKLGIVSYSVNTDKNGIEKVFRLSPLHAAVLGGQMDKVQLLLASKADINISNEYGVTPLQLAVVTKHVGLVEYLLQKGAKSDTADYYGIGLLQLAAYHGCVNVMELLLSKENFSVNDASLNFNITPLHAAAANEQVEAMEYLIQHGADVDAKIQESTVEPKSFIKVSKYARSAEISFRKMEFVKTNPVNGEPQNNKILSATPLHVAAQNGNINAVKLLVENTASITNLDILRNSPVHVASACGHGNVVRYLIETCNRSPINEKNIFGETCLHAAISAGNLNIAEYLIEQGADVNKVNEDCYTPLFLSVRADSVRLVEALIDKSKHTYHTCIVDNSISILQFASMRDSINVFNFLKSRNFDLTATTKILQNLLHLAAWHSSYEVANWLISNKVFDINQTDKTGRTPLHYTIMGMGVFNKDTSNGIRLLRLLLENNADVDASKYKKESPLFVAVNDSDRLCLEAVKILLKNGADPNFKRTFDGSSPLLASVKHGHSEAVDLLLKAGADINAPDNNGNTALHYACENEDKNMVSQLLKNKHINSRIRNNWNETPSGIASDLDCEEIVQMLAQSSRS